MNGIQVDLKTIEKIKLLRSHGHSLPEISKIVGVPKTTVFRYIENVQILPQYLTVWVGKRGGSKKKKLLKEKQAFDEARELIDQLTQREKLLFISALYWAEGSKKDFGLSNTDPDLIRIFIYFLRELFKIPDDRLRISVRIYEDLDRERCLTFWSGVVGIPEEKFVSVNILKGKKIGKLKYGMCRVRVSKGGDLLKKIKGINNRIVTLLSPCS